MAGLLNSLVLLGLLGGHEQFTAAVPQKRLTVFCKISGNYDNARFSTTSHIAAGGWDGATIHRWYPGERGVKLHATYRGTGRCGNHAHVGFPPTQDGLVVVGFSADLEGCKKEIKCRTRARKCLDIIPVESPYHQDCCDADQALVDSLKLGKIAVRGFHNSSATYDYPFPCNDNHAQSDPIMRSQFSPCGYELSVGDPTITQMATVPGRDLLVVAMGHPQSSSLMLLDLSNDGIVLASVSVRHVGQITGLAVSRDGKYLGVTSRPRWGGDPFNLYAVHPAELAEIGSVELPLESDFGGFLAVAFSDDSQRLALGGYGDQVNIYAVEPGNIMWRYSIPITSKNEFDPNIVDLTFSPNGLWLAVASSESLVLVDVVAATRPVVERVPGIFRSVSFSPNSEWLLACLEGDVVIFGFEAPRSWYNHTWVYVTVAFAPSALAMCAVLYASRQQNKPYLYIKSTRPSQSNLELTSIS